MNNFKTACFLFVALLVSTAANAQDDLGQVEFATSASPEAQSHFIRGVLLLHSFEYEDAAEAFRRAQQTQPEFAMAYWGEAMTMYRPIWNQLFTGRGREILSKLAPTAILRSEKAPTVRERAYLQAAEILFGHGDLDVRLQKYSDAMRKIHEQFPEDDEAAAFYALSILGTQRGERDFATYMRAAAIAEDVFARNSRHPGAAHYLIHSYDDPIHAPLGLRAAKAYASIAPAASHALHMPSHIFVAMGMWDRVATSNEESWRAAENRRLEKGLGKSARSYHALSWLNYAYLQQGRFEEARKLIDTIATDIDEDGTDRMRGYLVAMKAAYLVNSEQWANDVLEIEVRTADLSARTGAVNHFADGYAAAMRGDYREANHALQNIRDRRIGAERKGSNEAVTAEILEKELKAVLLAKSGNLVQAVDLLFQAAKLEEGMSFTFGPPTIVKPSHELLGEVLLEDRRYSEAMKAFDKALSRAPRRALSLRGLALSAAGARDMVLAQEAYSDLLAVTSSADAPIPSWEQFLNNVD